MRVATWNVNSIRMRADHVAGFLAAEKPDLLFLQELKCETAQFPGARFEALGYRAEAVGQKAYNGVAVLGRIPFEIRARALPGLDDPQMQARFIAVEADGITLAGLYCPNGNARGEEGYRYKLDWMAALRRYAAGMLAAERDLALLGDFNICPASADLAPGALDPADALVLPQSRASWRALLWLGLTDALRALHPAETLYTYWDYQAGAFEHDRGLRIDHALLSPRLAERLAACRVARAERGRDKPSDHVPLIVELG